MIMQQNLVLFNSGINMDCDSGRLVRVLLYLGMVLAKQSLSLLAFLVWRICVFGNLTMLAPSNWDRVCGSCEADVSAVRGLYCAGCRCVRYCNRQCQVNHWGHHADECSALARLREEVYVNELPEVVPLADFPDDTSGILHMTFPGNPGRWHGFTRRTASRDDVFVFARGGLRHWRRDRVRESIDADYDAYHRIWTLVFSRHGMTRAAVHTGGEHAGIPVFLTRGLLVNFSERRHYCVCLSLGALGLGLITGHRRSARRGPVEWHLHDWRVLLGEGGVPRAWRRGICYVGMAPLLPGVGMDLYRREEQRLARQYGLDTVLHDDADDA